MTLSAQSLTKRYGPGHEAVRGASLELRAGEFVSIVGRSGSGKSTLMAMLGALTRPTDGKVLLDGTDIWALSEAELARFRSRHIGFIFQFPSLLTNLTAVDNVAVPALLGRTMAAEEAYARAHDLLARVGLADRADAYPGSMSGGEQRRAVVARALINSPRAAAGRRADQRPRRGHRSRHHRSARAVAADQVVRLGARHSQSRARQAARSGPTRCAKACWPRAARCGDRVKPRCQPRRFGARQGSCPARRRPRRPPARTPIRLGRNLLPALQTVRGDGGHCCSAPC